MSGTSTINPPIPAITPAKALPAASLRHPICFRPIFKQVIWGGHRIALLKATPIPLDHVGESWEVSDMPGNISVVDDPDYPELDGLDMRTLIAAYGDALLGRGITERFGGRFPLLLKFIDARDTLSLQVHPGDEMALARHGINGKTEAWFVVDSDAGSKIYCGLAGPLTPDEFVERIADNTIMQAVGVHDAEPGQFYYIPAGTLHAIGAGCLIAEVQQSCDITYRVYDHDRRDAQGRSRELHTDLAREAISYEYPTSSRPIARKLSGSCRDAVVSPYFKIDYLQLTHRSEPHRLRHDGSSFTIVMVVSGTLLIRTPQGGNTAYSAGTTILLPAALDSALLRGAATALLVRL